MQNPQNFPTADRSQIEEIKQRINIEDVVKRYLKLKPVGKNLFGLCPFHKEDTPSFSVNTELGIFKCFGCGEHGDVIEFLKKVENIEFYEAISQLAKEAGIKLTYHKGDPTLAKKSTRAKKSHELATEYFSYLLTKHSLGKKAQDYLKKRALTNKAISEFKLGYAPPRTSKNSLVSFLIKKGFSESELDEFGLTIKKGNRTIDRFSDRLIFPIFSPTGEILGFSGRVIDKNDIRPKYINTPETLIFQKRRNLFGLYQAKKAIREEDFVILVEGQTDVISSWQVGIGNIVAPLGTGVGDSQIERLARFTKNLTICFDTDDAGQNASLRVAEIAYSLGLNVSAAEIPEGKDADECIRTNPKGWKNAIKKRKPAISYFINSVLKGTDPKSLEGKQTITKIILPIVASISDKIIQDHHIKEISLETGISEQIIKEALKSKSPADKLTNIKQILKKDSKIPQETYLLSLLLQFPESLAWASDKIILDDINNSEIRALIKQIVDYFKKEKNFIIKKFISSLDERATSLCKESILRPLWASEPNTDTVTNEINNILHQLKRAKIKNEISELKEKLSAAEKNGETRKANEILNTINSKILELEALNNN